ncbi:hypothetical protein BC826DRAFT_1047097, partial [Russula brevipes]
ALIHGLSIPSLIWKGVAPPLALRGYCIFTAVVIQMFPKSLMMPLRMQLSWRGGVLVAFAQWSPSFSPKAQGCSRHLRPAP